MTTNRELLLESAQHYGTPLYVYDGDLFLKRYQDLQTAIPWPKLRILYAMKANYCPALLQLLEGNGSSIDTVSPGDVIMALKCGFSKERILFTSNNITDTEMDQVHQLGILFNIDSLSRLDKYGKAYPGSSVCLRFNPDVVAGAHQNIQTGGELTKFGILLNDLGQAVEIIRRHSLKVVGLHKHTGSGIKETELFLKAVKNLLRIASADNFPDLQFIDLGGGYSVPYQPDEKRIDYAFFGQELVSVFSGFCEEYGKELELLIEPGKYISAEAGTLLVRVNTLKNNNNRLIVGTDSGFSQLIRPMLYGAFHQIDNLSNPSAEEFSYDICGNICETGDRFAEQRSISEIREGDLLAIRNAGAYCYAMGSCYNLRPMPAEVLLRNGEARLARRRLSSAELVEAILGECS